MPKGKPVAIYTDGGLLTHNPSEVGGTWAFVLVDKNDFKVGGGSGWVLASKLRIPVVTNNHTEHIALIRAMEAVPEGWCGEIFSDSQVAICRVESDYQLAKGVRRFPAAEANLPDFISLRSKTAAARLGASVRFTLVQGHPTKSDLERGWGKKRNLPVSKWNVMCDDMCNEAKLLYRATVQLDGLIADFGSEGVLEMMRAKVAVANI